MFGINIWIFITIIMLLIVPPVFCQVKVKKVKVVCVFLILGILIYLLSQKVLRTWLMKVVYGIIPYSSEIWNVRWLYGLVQGFSIAIFTWILSAGILYFFKVLEIGTKRTRGTLDMLLAIGFGWISSYNSWGNYMLQVVIDHVKSPEFDYYGLGSWVLVNHMVQFLISYVFYVGLMFLVQYGVVVGKTLLYTAIAILIHSLTKMYLYVVPFGLNLSDTIVNIFYTIITGLVLFSSWKLLNRAPEIEKDEFVN